MALEECAKWMDCPQGLPENFDGLLAAWLARLDTEELNKKFYRELCSLGLNGQLLKEEFPTDENRTLKPRRARHPLNHAPTVRLVYQREGIGCGGTVQRAKQVPATCWQTDDRRHMVIHTTALCCRTYFLPR